MIDPTKRVPPIKPGARRTTAVAASCALTVLMMSGVVTTAVPETRPTSPAPVEFGVDRSNMGTQWTLAWPQEPKASPFLAAEYNKPGNFEARRVAVMDGIARVHAGWFRDGFGGSDQAIDLLRLVHARGRRCWRSSGTRPPTIRRGPS
jgi:hypothetical protein